MKWVLFALACFSFASETPKRLTSLQRLDEARMEAVHRARLEWSRQRVVHPQLGLYHDFRAVLHVHAEDAKHTLGTREQVLTAAKETGVDVIMWSDHNGPKPDTWTGMRKGVLFIAGGEVDHALLYPKTGADLKFMSHLEETPDASSDGFAGMEIYNRHSDAKAHEDLLQYVQQALLKPGEFKKLAGHESRYPDEVYAAGTDPLEGFIARYDREIAKHHFTAIAANDAHRNQVFNGVVFDPYEVAFRFVSTHVLAQYLTEDQIRQSLRDGHAYVAFDWLCDPNGFSYVAINNFGVYDMGDRAPMLPNTRLVARFPIPAHIKLFRNGTVVEDTTGAEMTFVPKEEGAYRLEAWLSVAGEERQWIFSNPLYVEKPAAAELALPPTIMAANVKVLHDIVYTQGKPEDANKHKLDLYLPANKTKFPVMLFVHGGAWRTGDRNMYGPIGNRFAKAGIGVVIPSYRLAPANAPPAQIEDVAAAFAWTVKHVAEHGGDPSRISVAGHSAGGHLASLLALDPRYLRKYDLTPQAIQGVVSISGIYDVRQIAIFGPDEHARRMESPIEYVNRHAPPFLVMYSQWDYPGLPAQARAFDRSLRHNFVASSLRYIPGENHISEIVNASKDDDPTVLDMLRFLETAPR